MKNLKIIDKTKENILPVIFILTIIIIWQFIVEFKNIPQYLMPTPMEIIEVFKEDFDTLKDHTLVTLYEGVVGFIYCHNICTFIGNNYGFCYNS